MVSVGTEREVGLKSRTRSGMSRGGEEEELGGGEGFKKV